jgi:hypothetical protein
MSLRIELQGVEKLNGKLRRLINLQAYRHGLTAAAVHVKGQIATYPKVRRGPQPFKTDKQRRGFFAKLKAGEIEVPYRRGISPNSQRLDAKWFISMLSDLRASIVNTATYARLVHDRTQQSRYHEETGWKTAQGVAEDPAVLSAVERILQKTVDEFVKE